MASKRKEVFVVLHASGISVAVVMTEIEEEAVRKFAEAEGIAQQEMSRLNGDTYAFVKTKVIE